MTKVIQFIEWNRLKANDHKNCAFAFISVRLGGSVLGCSQNGEYLGFIEEENASILTTHFVHIVAFDSHIRRQLHVIKRNEYLFMVKRFPQRHFNISECLHVQARRNDLNMRYGRGIDEQFYSYRSIKWCAPHNMRYFIVCVIFLLAFLRQSANGDSPIDSLWGARCEAF